MNSHPTHPHPSASGRRRPGFALVLVVLFLALSLVTMTALLSSTQTESQSSLLLAETSRSRLLADSVTALAAAQLRSAIEPDADATVSKLWTSQPGAIRTHRATGDLETIYKLYSASSLMVESEAELAADLPPADWQQRPAHFVDLNAPQVTPDGMQFPILDPRAMSRQGGLPVEGFTYTAEAAPTGTVANPETPEAMRLPMPVRWLYQLQDGTLGTLNADGRFTASTSGRDGKSQPVRPSAQNPIVARMAFWVDDESCKINVNTAAEGAFWDTPRADTTQERALAQNQPTRLEYQRQPGHPAGVCLSSFLLPGQRFHPQGFSSQMTAMAKTDAENLWRLGRLWVAEHDTGTSEGGTMLPALLGDPAAAPLPRTRQRRFASLTELVFDSATSPGGTSSAGFSRSRQLFFSQRPEALHRLRQAQGFLTTRSAAPEVTLFGTPRITLWPVHQNTPEPTPEKVIASTSAPDPTADFQKFTRYDRTARLVSQFRDESFIVMRSEPGNGANDLEIHAQKQNLRLLNYLRQLTDRPVPGWVGGGNNSFAAKYGTDPVTGDRDSLLLSCLDYVRSANFADGQLKANTQFSVLCPGPGQEYHGFGQVSPLQARVTGPNAALSDHARGQGRVMTVSEIALVIVCRAEAYLAENGQIRHRGEPTPLGREQMKNAGDREYEVGLVVEGFLTSQGWTDYRPFTSMALVGGAPGDKPDARALFPAFRLNGQTLVRSRSAPSVISSPEDVPVRWRGWGGNLGTRALSDGALSLGCVVIPADASASESQPPQVHFEGAAFESGRQLKLCVYDTPGSAAALSSSATDLLHVIPLRLPDIVASSADEASAEWRLPRLPTVTAGAYGLVSRQQKAARGTQSLLNPEDIVQSLIPAHADYRVLNARRWQESRSAASGTSESAKPLFVSHPDWGLRRHAHSLKDPLLYPEGQAPAGVAASSHHFFNDLTLTHSDQSPDFPHATGRQVRVWSTDGWMVLNPQAASDQLRLDNGQRGPAWPSITGDFDNGVGNCPDGAYTARPDDGNWAATLNAASGSGLPYFDPDVFSQTGQSVPPVTSAGFSAQRMLPSAVAFGSLPTGVRSQVPWQTLLFRPQADHYGATNPPDHLLLDLFWSPVLEPEPVSRPFETDGKVNLNHQIAPFAYIHRSTALHAVLKAETLMAIPDAAAGRYKQKTNGLSDAYRHYIDAAGTLKLWKEAVFDQGKTFISPSQICEHPLVPEGITATAAAVQSFWATHRLTGDNTKERPYAHLYPRLTTRSNVFRVHFIVETLKKVRGTQPDAFDPAQDQVTARHQGSRLIRRTLDTTRTDLPRYLPPESGPVATTPKPLDLFYDWQVE